jgi:hypothetical protein
MIVTELASECVCVWRGECYTPHPLAYYVTINAETTVHCSPGSSMPCPTPFRSLPATHEKLKMAKITFILMLVKEFVCKQRTC